MQKIQLPRHVVTQIMSQAQSTPDAEICGLVSCHNHTYNVIPVTNVAEDPARFFEMDPAETIAAIKTMRENQAELFAIYHSHPSTAATPSKADIEQHGYPDALQLILSLNTVGVLELKGYKIQQDSVVAIDLVL